MSSTSQIYNQPFFTFQQRLQCGWLVKPIWHLPQQYSQPSALKNEHFSRAHFWVHFTPGMKSHSEYPSTFRMCRAGSWMPVLLGNHVASILESHTGLGGGSGSLQEIYYVLLSGRGGTDPTLIARFFGPYYQSNSCLFKGFRTA